MGLPSQVPIVIGVTGHRDLRPQDMPALEREIGGVITRLRRDYTGEGPDATPLILISALAEGADRVCARVALSMGVKLIAPLPLPADEYRHDFEPGLHPGASADFDELLSLAAAAPVMPFTPGNSLEAVRTDPDKRAEQYRAVGLFIVQHCDVLVALWDFRQRKGPRRRRHWRGRDVQAQRHSAGGQRIRPCQPRRIRDRTRDTYRDAAHESWKSGNGRRGPALGCGNCHPESGQRPSGMAR